MTNIKSILAQFNDHNNKVDLETTYNDDQLVLYKLGVLVGWIFSMARTKNGMMTIEIESNMKKVY
jgi:hypothetical protein